jgi:sugar O-acyltransferase (sialic acid O-acetyltransferase NeuD family)
MLAGMLYEDSLRHPDFKIVAFVQDEEYLDPSGSYLGLPQVGLKAVRELYPTSSFDMIVLTASYHEMRNREGLYHKAKALGYSLRNYISPSAIVSADVEMGENNFICEQVFLGARGQLGSCNTIRQQVYLGHDFTMGNNNVITPGCKIGGNCVIENNCYIGIGATIINKTRIAEETLVGAGSLVLKDTEPFSKNVGNPSRVLGYHREEGLKVNV